MRVDLSPVNVALTKYHNSKNTDRNRLLKESNVPSSAINYVAKNEGKFVAIGMRVTLFVLNNM